MHIAPLGNRQLERVNEEVLVLEILLLSRIGSILNLVECLVLLT